MPVDLFVSLMMMPRQMKLLEIGVRVPLKRWIGCFHRKIAAGVGVHEFCCDLKQRRRPDHKLRLLLAIAGKKQLVNRITIDISSVRR